MRPWTGFLGLASLALPAPAVVGTASAESRPDRRGGVCSRGKHAVAQRPVAPDVCALPGASRAISHSSSASRDAALLAYQILPYTTLMGGGDVALVGLELEQLSLRFGFRGFIELSSNRPLESSDTTLAVLPSAGVPLWRGQDWVVLAISYDEASRRWFGERGEAELTVSYAHESEHFTGDRQGNAGLYPDVPNIGDFTMLDAAIRIPVDEFDFELRLQHKRFISGEFAHAYTHGPGFDAVVRWRLSPTLHLFSATFGEYLVGNDVEYRGRVVTVPDNYLVRNLTGVAFPGVLGEAQVASSLSVGHGKGLLAFQEELLWGLAIRLAIF